MVNSISGGNSQVTKIYKKAEVTTSQADNAAQIYDAAHEELEKIQA